MRRKKEVIKHMPQNDITALLAQVAPLSERKTEIDNKIHNLKLAYEGELRTLVAEQRQVEDEIKKKLTHLNALFNGNSLGKGPGKSIGKSAAVSDSLSARGRRRGRNAMQNSMTLQSAITKVLENRAYWGVEHADMDGLKTREIADAIYSAQIWSPSNPSLFLGQVSQTISRMKKEGLVQQGDDRRYALIVD